MKTKGNWVIKTSNGLYWCGNNSFSEQIRKAQIYHWKEKAEEQATHIFKRNKIENVTWEVISIVEPKELKDTESKWNCCYEETRGIAEVWFTCSNCGRSALNDYRARSLASRFCPHCGKYMINHTMPEEDD